MNIYAHRRDANNPGDYWSSPGVWLNAQLPGELFDYKKLADITGQTVDNLIIGGGGLGEKFLKCCNIFLTNNTVRHTVIWGTAWEQNRSDLQNFANRCSLIGVREWYTDTQNQQQWVPCASVLHSRLPILTKHQPTQDWLIVDHWKRKTIKFKLPHTRMTNYKSSINQIVTAIADHNIVLTSSYHVVYWSILLKRRVVFVSNPWVPKVDHMRWPIPCADTFSWQLIDHAHIYPDAYKQARQANLDFLSQIQSLSELPTQNNVIANVIHDSGSPTNTEINGS